MLELLSFTYLCRGRSTQGQEANKTKPSMLMLQLSRGGRFMLTFSASTSMSVSSMSRCSPSSAWWHGRRDEVFHVFLFSCTKSQVAAQERADTSTADIFETATANKWHSNYQCREVERESVTITGQKEQLHFMNSAVLSATRYISI